MKEYVLGFCFSMNNVWLMQKERPDWQKGRLNGFGGHIKENEKPLEAMKRESLEEVGFADYGWQKFGEMTNRRSWKVHLFRGSIVTPKTPNPKTMTDEKVVCVSLGGLLSRWAEGCPSLNMVPNLSWLIPMAIEVPLGTEYETIFIENAWKEEP